MIHDPKGLMRLEFQCPVCGGSRFGTSNACSDNAIGHCHSLNFDGTMCTFSWKRTEAEDAKYFVSNGVSYEIQEKTDA